MNILVVGLGSMGKRRIRCLKALGVDDIWGVDIRDDRREEAANKYGIVTSDDLHAAVIDLNPDAIVISTPPDKHFAPAVVAVENNIPCFIEASVIASDVQKLIEHCAGGSFIAPSCTMKYFPGPKNIKAMIGSGTVGKPLNINYHVGQYLPDWHPWENIKDFYVGQRATGGCREILPFELTWLNDIFGEPEPLTCVKTKVSNLSVDIDDVYHCVLRYPENILANITIDVISKVPLRQLTMIGSETTFMANFLESSEEYYVDELRDFIDAVKRNDSTLFPNTLAEDYRILNILQRLEDLSATKK